MARSTVLNSSAKGVAGAGLQRYNTKSIPQGHSLQWTWTPRSTMVNEARANYTRFTLYDDFVDPVQLGNAAVNGAVGTVNVNGLSQLGQFSFMARQTAQNNYQLSDDLSWVRGRHSLKMGGVVRRLHLNSGTITPGFTGQLRFNSISDFLAGRAASYSRNIGNPYIGQRAWESGVYFQDDFQITQRLQLNLGLRYEYNTPPGEVNNLIPQKYSFQPDRNNFAPRFGFALQLDRAAQTVLRGGYGIYYNVLELSFTGLTRFNPPLVGNIVAANPAFPNLAGNASQTIPSGLVIPQSNARQPYAQHLNLTIERQLLNRNATVSVGYVGTRSLKAPRTSRPNGGDGLVQALRPDPSVGVVNYLETAANSNYNSLQMTFNVRRRDFTLRTSYTWSKFLDEVSDFPTGNQNIDRGLLALDERNWKLNYGASDFDMRHVFVTAYTYDLPWMRRNRFIGGWSLQGITTIQSGRPYTLFSGTDNLFGTNNNRILDLPATLIRNGGSARRAIDLAPGASRAQITPTRGTLGTIGRNTENGDRLMSFNISAFKDFGLTERVRLQFRAEAFNIFNTVSYGVPDGVLTSPNFGQAITAFDPRQIQLALRLTF